MAVRQFTRHRNVLFGAHAGVCLVLAMAMGAAAEELPNIILCMGDDHAWEETGYNGHPLVRTPVLDEMAASGLRLDRFYSAHPSCSPTRGSVLTGRHPNRYGEFAPGWSIRPEEITIAQLLGQAGYARGQFGKWHVGPVKANSPTNPGAMGFDTWLSHDNFFEMNPWLSRDGGVPRRIEGEGSEIIVDEAIRFIARAKQNQKPFLAVVWFGSPHEPYSGLKDDLALYDQLPEMYRDRLVKLTSMTTGQQVERRLGEVLRERYAEITAMDRAIGKLRAYLKENDLRDNTLLWYCGDNGSSKEAGKHKFIGDFVGKMPSDVGGSGLYTHWNTTLGSVSAYVERFRGNDDLLADVERRQKAADRLADLLQGWLASQLEGEPGFAKLRGFLQDGLRRDLKNLSLYTWAYGIVSDDDQALSECLVRLGQYLVERSYFTPDQLPEMTRAVQEADRDGPARLLGFIQRFIASKMGVAADEPIPKGLDFLSNPRAVTASINGFLRQTKEFKSRQRAWEGEKATNPKMEPPDPSEMLIELALEAFFPRIQLGRSDRLGVKLAATTEPFLTNGQWDDKARQIHWSDDMPATDSKQPELPTLLYAFWSKPDEQVQKASFGRVVLQGSALGNYCLWYRGLSTQEAKEWDEFISSLRPDDGLVRRLGKFRFSHEPPAREDDETEDDLASTPRELILKGLRGEAAAK